MAVKKGLSKSVRRTEGKKGAEKKEAKGKKVRALSLKELSALPWKTINRPLLLQDMDQEGAVCEFEELDMADLGIQTSADGGLLMAVDESVGNDEELEELTEDDHEEWVGFEAAPTDELSALPTPVKLVSIIQEAGKSSKAKPPIVNVNKNWSKLLPKWAGLPLTSHSLSLIHAYPKDLVEPTEIQNATLPLSLTGRDVVGVAQTGSGKTLAYLLPHVQRAKAFKEATGRLGMALILVPTRELALQVAKTVQELDATLEIATIIGGMSVQKQQRLLKRATIWIATPGRLWDILQNDEQLASCLRPGLSLKEESSITEKTAGNDSDLPDSDDDALEHGSSGPHLDRQMISLILDEADRLVEKGHFAELENIIRLSHRIRPDANDNAADAHPLQSLVFSATMDKELQRNLSKKSGFKPFGSKKFGEDKSTLSDLMSLLDFRDTRGPAVIDLTPEHSVSGTLSEARIDCLATDKDLYLYYLLLRYPGRFLIFVASLDSVRRLVPLLTLLDIPAFPLHSGLQQRQRLKHLDSFKKSSTAALIATDVAARGIDMPIDVVVHYHMPRSTDAYVHRSGRTARAGQAGSAICLISPEERRASRAIQHALKRDHALAELSINMGLLDQLRARITLAKKIDSSSHHDRKEKADKKWMKEAAEALDIESDVSESDGENDHKSSSTKWKESGAKNARLKADLTRLLKRPVMVKGVSTRYITSGSAASGLISDLLQPGTNFIGAGVADTREHMSKKLKKHSATRRPASKGPKR